MWHLINEESWHFHFMRSTYAEVRRRKNVTTALFSIFLNELCSFAYKYVCVCVCLCVLFFYSLLWEEVRLGSLIVIELKLLTVEKLFVRLKDITKHIKVLMLDSCYVITFHFHNSFGWFHRVIAVRLDIHQLTRKRVGNINHAESFEWFTLLIKSNDVQLKENMISKMRHLWTDSFVHCAHGWTMAAES